MQKKIIVLAIAGAIAGLAAGSASADMSAPSVSFYGLLDYGYLNRGGDTVAGANNSLVSGASQNSFNSGISAGSRLGVKGGKTLDNGAHFLYEIEYGITVDNNGKGSNSNTSNSATTNPASTFWNRHSYIGFTGDWGTAVGGRVEGARYSFANKYDPFAGGTVGNFGSLIGNQARADNAIAYISPTFGGGFSALLAYTTNLTGNENKFNNGDARLYVIAPQYNNGPLSVTYDYEDATVHGLSTAVPALAPASTGGDIKINVLGGSYDLAVVKFLGYWESVKASDALAPINLDQKAWLLGATAPFGDAIVAKISYGSVKDNNVNSVDCKKTSLGMDYKLDKSFNVYADFATISNGTNSSCTIATTASNYSGGNAGIVNAGVDSTLPGNQTGFGTRGVDVGVKYTF